MDEGLAAETNEVVASQLDDHTRCTSGTSPATALKISPTRRDLRPPDDLPARVEVQVQVGPEIFPEYERFRTKTAREIPVVLITPHCARFGIPEWVTTTPRPSRLLVADLRCRGRRRLVTRSRVEELVTTSVSATASSSPSTNPTVRVLSSRLSPVHVSQMVRHEVGQRPLTLFTRSAVSLPNHRG